MDWDREVEVEGEGEEEEEVVVVILCNAMQCNAIYTILLDLYSQPHIQLSTRLLLLVFGACKYVQVPSGHHIASSNHLGWLGWLGCKIVSFSRHRR